MSAKFHIALFCSDAIYDTRKLFYTKVFRAPPSQEDTINEGEAGHEYWGSCWDCANGIIFALLKDPSLTGDEERLAHVGFFFDSRPEFDDEIKKRDVDTRFMKTYEGGIKQAFKKDKNGIEWELTFQPLSSGN